MEDKVEWTITLGKLLCWIMNTDINHIIVNGAQIAFNKMRRAQSFNALLYYYAEIGVYLEVSLSHGAGITAESHEQIDEIYKQATHFHMSENKRSRRIN